MRDLRELEALFGEHPAHDALDAADEAGIDERVEADGHAFVAQLLLDLRLLDLLRARIVDDLDALPLFHVEDDVLPDGAVVVRGVLHLHPEVVQEVRGPQALEVLEDRLLVEGRPHPVARPAGPALDVILVRLRVDDRDVALRRKAQLDVAEQRRRIRGRKLRGGLGGLGRRRRRRLRRLDAADRGRS